MSYYGNWSDIKECEKKLIFLFQLIAGIFFILCLLFETKLENVPISSDGSFVCMYSSINFTISLFFFHRKIIEKFFHSDELSDEHLVPSLYVNFLFRIVLGALIGIIYLLSVIERLSKINHLTAAFTCIFSMATIVSVIHIEVPIETCSASLILVYSLIALNLSSSNWLFPQTHAKNKVNKNALHLDFIEQPKNSSPLIYLAGAKLMTIFCYFLPFACIVSQSFALHTVDNTITEKNFTDLIVLFFIRLVLGIITISLVRHTVNFLSMIYLMPLAILLAVILIIPFHELRCLLECTIKIRTIIMSYVAFSLIVDVIGHHSAFTSNADSNSVPKTISLTFATFIDFHLIDVLLVVIYLSDWISAKMIMTSITIISLTLIFHKLKISCEPNNRVTKEETNVIKHFWSLNFSIVEFINHKDSLNLFQV